VENQNARQFARASIIQSGVRARRLRQEQSVVGICCGSWKKSLGSGMLEVICIRDAEMLRDLVADCPAANRHRKGKR